MNFTKCIAKLFSKMALMVLMVCLAALPCLASAGVETVVRSPIVHGTNGLAIDNDNHLVIASIESQAVFVMDTDTGKILKTYKDRLITGPDDVSVAKDGSIYYTDIFSGNVGKISPDGKVTLIANLGPWVNSLRLNPNDETKLYVGHCIGDDRLTEIDLKTGKIRIVAEKVGWPNSSSFGPDGNYYSPLNMRGEVIRWNLQTGAREVVFRIPTPPSSVKFDSQGRMLVTEFVTGTVNRTDLKTKETKVIGKNLTMGLDNIAIDKNGRMFLASNHFGGIQELFEDGTTKELAPVGLLIPSGIGMLKTPEGEWLAVADIWNVKFFDPKTGKQTWVMPSGFYPWVDMAKYPDAGEEFLKRYRYMIGTGLPMTAAATADGNFLVMTSWQSNCVQVYDMKERRLARNIDGNRPIYAMMFGGNLAVSELTTHSVVSIAADGTRTTLAAPLGLFKDAGKEQKESTWLTRMVLAVYAFFNDGLVYPAGMAAQGNNLYVAEWYRGEVLQIVADGKALDKPKVVAKGLERPEGIAFAKDGSLLVVESEIGRLDKIDLASGKKTVLAEHLKTGEKAGFKAVPSYLFSGVAVGSDGSIYVSCDEATEVVKVKE